MEAAKRCLPQRKVKKKKSYVKDKQLKNLCKISKAAWNMWRDAGRPSSGPLAEEKKHSKKNVRQFVAAARARQVRSTIQKRDQMFKGNHPSRFKTSGPKTTCTKLIVDGQSITDTHSILSSFKSFYESLIQSNLQSTEKDTVLSDMYDSSLGTNELLLDTEISLEEIEHALKLLKPRKSGGPDGLSPEHVMYGGDVLKLWLKKIYNRIIELEDLPSCLKAGLVIPVYKRQGKDPLKVNSYRGITLSPVLSKVLEIVLLQRLSTLLYRRTRIP